MIGPTNIELAEALDQMAEVLVRQGESNPYRVQAYLQAAAMIRDLDAPVAQLYGEGGRDALTALPGIGVNLAHHLAQYVETGRIGLRDRLLRADDPAELLATVPGVSLRLAQRLVDELGVESLSELERAALDGRLQDLDGVGPRRTEAIRRPPAPPAGGPAGGRPAPRRGRRRARDGRRRRGGRDTACDRDPAGRHDLPALPACGGVAGSEPDSRTPARTEGGASTRRVPLF